jgi:glucose/arabinose dehydrogenase
MRYTVFIAAFLCLAISASGMSNILAAPPAQIFAETGYAIDGRFQQYWQRHGGLPVFGFPISEQRLERGSEGLFEVQWFERERFDYHPKNSAPYDVLLGRLGDEALRQAGRDWRSFPPGERQAGCLFFEQTQHTLCEPFLSYWQTNGLEFDGSPGKSFDESLALFGLPLSEPMMETNSSGFTVLTQWFERARFEYLPDNPDPFKVLLGRLGAEVFAPGRANPDPAANLLPVYNAVQQPGWPAPLEVPHGFTIEEVANRLQSPRFMALDRDGSLVYGSQATGVVVRLRDANNDGRYETQQLIAEGLPFVHSVSFVNGQLYAASESQVVRLGDFGADGRAASIEVIIDNLPEGSRDLYGHRTRTIVAGPDGKIYLSIGSSCDVCEETTPLRAAVVRANPDGSELEAFASGLRNTVGLAFHPFTGQLWGVDMGRNNLGPNLPPEELNRIEQGRNYGWPYCYGNRVPDPEFGDAARCANTTAPDYAFPAHWAPLGIAFYDQAAFPASYQGDALIAFHGSAPEQVSGARIGCNLTRVRFKNGQPVAHEDLIRGFANGNTVWGRPAGVLVTPDGNVLVSDDWGGRIFRLRYLGR